MADITNLPHLQEVAKQVNQPMAELGVTGLKTMSGMVFEEFLRDLQGERGRRVYTEMSLNDPVIAGLLFAVEMPLREVEWTFKRQSDNQADQDAEEFLQGAMDDMSLAWADFITEVLSMLVFGWSYFEIVYKRREGRQADPRSNFDDGRIGWRKFALRAQDTLNHWEFDNNGGLRAMVQDTFPSNEQIGIPIEKSILFRTRTAKGNPEGRSVLRTAYRPWYFKKNLEMIEAIALERMGAGFPVVYLPERWTPTDLSIAKNLVRGIRVDEQMGITFPGPKQTPSNPHGWLFELVAPASSRGVATGFSQSIQRYRAEMLMSVVASFIALGTQAVGSFALSRDQRDFFQTALEGWLMIISDTFNRFATPTLLELNGFRNQAPITLEHTPVGQADLRTLASYVQGLGQLGFLTPGTELEQWLRRAGGMPEMLEDDIAIAEEARRMALETGLDNNAQQEAEKAVQRIMKASEPTAFSDEPILDPTLLARIAEELKPYLEDEFGDD